MISKHYPPPRKTTQRRSGVELLRLIAILLICTAHGVQTLESFVDFRSATANPPFLILQMLRFCGNIGNILFIICSSYFLVNSTKTKKEKVIGLLLDSTVISVGILVSFILFCTLFSVSYHFTFWDIVKNILPDMYEQVWFVPTYALFYLIHPYINSALNIIGRKKHFAVCCAMVVIYSLGGLINAKPVYSDLLGFAFIFIIVSYLKLYRSDLIKNVKLNAVVFLISTFVFAGTVAGRNLLALDHPFFEDFPNIDGMCSVVFLPMLISLFNLFLDMDFSSRLINTAASCSLFIYCIHENAILRAEIRPKYYEFVFARFGDERALFFALLCGVGMFAGALILALIYKYTIHKLTGKASVKIKEKLTALFDFLYMKSNKKLPE